MSLELTDISPPEEGDRTIGNDSNAENNFNNNSDISIGNDNIDNNIIMAIILTLTKD